MKQSKYYLRRHKELIQGRFQAENIFGLQTHEGTTDKSLYIDGENLGSFSEAALEALVGLIRGCNECEVEWPVFKQAHFLH